MHDKPDTIEGWLAQLGGPGADRDYRPGHARMQALLDGLDMKAPPLTIRVAGTNGKGSTATMLAAALTACGYRVGLYTSPHLHRFSERIRIDGVEAEEPVLAACLGRLMPRALETGASYFEVATAMALGCFSESHVNVQILEAGVGARLDATTAVPAQAAVLTPIGLDHQAWLGDTLAAIAGEKAWAMHGCAVALSAPQAPEAMAVLRAHRPDLVVLDAVEVEAMPELAMAGAHQRLNAALAWHLMQQLGEAGVIALRRSKALAAIAATELPGRLEPVVWRGRRIWLDAAHNRHAVEALLPGLAAMAPLATILVLTREDRDLSDVAPLLRPLTRYLVIERGNDRETVFRTLDHAVLDGGEGEVLVLGSFVTLQAAGAWLRERA